MMTQRTKSKFLLSAKRIFLDVLLEACISFNLIGFTQMETIQIARNSRFGPSIL